MCRLDVYLCGGFFVFFFKQKTAYEMRISDWSSDVCSSDLDDDGEDQRLDADALQRADIAHLRDADDQRREEQGDDQHEQEAEENLADGAGDIGGYRFDPGRVGRSHMGDEPEGQADDEADQHFHLQRDAASVFSHWPSRSEEHTSELQSLM